MLPSMLPAAADQLTTWVAAFWMAVATSSAQIFRGLFPVRRFSVATTQDYTQPGDRPYPFTRSKLSGRVDVTGSTSSPLCTLSIIAPHPPQDIQAAIVDESYQTTLGAIKRYPLGDTGLTAESVVQLAR